MTMNRADEDAEVLGQPRVYSRTSGPPCSNVCCFEIDSLPGVSFIAYALADGSITVQKVCAVCKPVSCHRRS